MMLTSPQFKKDPNYKDILLGCDSSKQGPHIVQTFLKKEKNTKSLGRMFGSFNIRFFTLNMQTFEFYYTPKDHYSSKDIKYIDLAAIRKVEDKGHMQTPAGKKVEWSFQFNLTFDEKQLNLFCQNEIMKRLWLHSFQHIIRISDSRPLMNDEIANQVASNVPPSTGFKAHILIEGPKNYHVPTSFSENPKRDEGIKQEVKQVESIEENKVEMKCASEQQSQIQVKQIEKQKGNPNRNELSPTIALTPYQEQPNNASIIDDFSTPSPNIKKMFEGNIDTSKLVRKSPIGLSIRGRGGSVATIFNKKNDVNHLNTLTSPQQQQKQPAFFANDVSQKRDQLLHLENKIKETEVTFPSKNQFKSPIKPQEFPKAQPGQTKYSSLTNFDNLEEEEEEEGNERVQNQTKSMVLRDRSSQFSRKSRNASKSQLDVPPSSSIKKPAILSENDFDKWDHD